MALRHHNGGIVALRCQGTYQVAPLCDPSSAAAPPYGSGGAAMQCYHQITVAPQHHHLGSEKKFRSFLT
ncbi:hypothetical protein TorRG33x02_227990 [Trema orientale]|uniref:Uncharacterized protein n=1 Tax=Trema orientale TaxID=63057 RepID=A0A2P5E7B5_TREOI|nr:hypothetical protein TorRG33x02_227990 [Trema orientale]